MIRAIAGLTTYRCVGRYGFIYIGARSTAEARNEAHRSTSGDIKNLEFFNGASWEAAK